MLEPQVVVNLLPKFAIGVDLMRHIVFWPYFSSWEVISGLYPFLRKILAGVAKKFTNDRARAFVEASAYAQGYGVTETREHKAFTLTARSPLYLDFADNSLTLIHDHLRLTLGAAD